MSGEAGATAKAVAMPVPEDECDEGCNVIWVLHLEDNADDQEIIRCALAEGSLSCHIVAVQTREDFERRLKSETWDVILADMTLPGLTATRPLISQEQFARIRRLSSSPARWEKTLRSKP